METVPAKINKSVFLSKTFYFGVMTAIAPMFPAVELWLSQNIATASLLWGSLAVVLRLVTKDKVVLKD
jgi:hypothetical protein